MTTTAKMKLSILCFVLLLALAVVLFVFYPFSVEAREEISYISSKEEFHLALSQGFKTIYVDDIEFDVATIVSINYSVKIIGKQDLSTLKNIHFDIIGPIIVGDRISVTFENVIFDGAYDISGVDLDEEKAFEEIFGTKRDEYRCINGSTGYFDLEFCSCEFKGYVSYEGAAIYIGNEYHNDTKSLTLQDCSFYGNVSQLGTVCVISYNTNSALNSCEFSNNYATMHAGAWFCFGHARLLDVQITNNFYCPFDGLEYIKAGGSLCFVSVNALVSNSEISNNETVYGGGLGIATEVSGNAKTLFSNCTVKNNVATYGGAVYAESQAGQGIFFDNCEISGNTATIGSSLYAVRNEYANAQGAAGLIEFSFCTFSNNTANDENSFSYYDLSDQSQTGVISLLGCIVTDRTFLTLDGTAPTYTYTGADISSAVDITVPHGVYRNWGDGAYNEIRGDLHLGRNDGLDTTYDFDANDFTQRIITVPITYGVFALLSLGLLAFYFIFVKERQLYMLLAVISLCVATIGFFSLSISTNLVQATISRLVCHLGVVFLPLTLLLTVAGICRFRYKKYVAFILFAITVIVYIGASVIPCFLTGFEFFTVDRGLATIKSARDSINAVRYIYNIVYSLLTLGIVIYSTVRKKLVARPYINLMAVIVSVKLATGLLQVLFGSRFNFAIISSYIVTLILVRIYELLGKQGNKDSFQAVVENSADELKPVTSSLDISDTSYVVFSKEQLETVCDYLVVNSILSNREIEVVVLLLKGYKRKKIADMLFVTENTIKTHVAHIFTKLDVNGREELRDKVYSILNEK